MYEILFHILGLAFLEIIFYFEYVGPMETKVFKKSLDDAVKSLIKSINTEDENKIRMYINNDPFIKYLLGNSTEYQNKIENQYKDSIKDREDYNNDLFNKCVIYWILSFVGSLIFIIIVYFVYLYFLKNKCKSEENLEVEMNVINQNTVNAISYDNIQEERKDEELNPTDSIDTINSSNAYSIYKDSNKFKIVKYVTYYVLSFGGILLFEYIFFNHVVLKYKITTNDEIRYITYEQLKSFIFSPT